MKDYFGETMNRKTVPGYRIWLSKENGQYGYLIEEGRFRPLLGSMKMSKIFSDRAECNRLAFKAVEEWGADLVRVVRVVSEEFYSKDKELSSGDDTDEDEDEDD